MLGIWDVASTDVTHVQGFGKPGGGGGAGARPGCGDDNVVCNWWPGHPSRADRRTGRGGLIRHVTSDTRSLITPGIAHIGHMSHPTPSDTRHHTRSYVCNVRASSSQEGIKRVQRIQRQREYVMRAISSPSISWCFLNLSYLLILVSDSSPLSNKWWYPVIDMIPALIDDIIIDAPAGRPPDCQT